MRKSSGKTVENTAPNLVISCDQISTGWFIRTTKSLTNCVKSPIFNHFTTNFLTTFSTPLLIKINLKITSFTHFTQGFITMITNLLIKRRRYETYN